MCVIAPKMDFHTGKIPSTNCYHRFYLKIEFKIQRRRKNVLASLLWLKSTRLSNIFGDFISKEVTKLVKNTLKELTITKNYVLED